MGSWSEGCAISGLEVGERQECYVILLGNTCGSGHGHGPDSIWRIVLPPVRGEYNDYGRYILTDEQNYLDLVTKLARKLFPDFPALIQGEEIDQNEYSQHSSRTALIAGEEILDVMVVHSEIFDTLVNLPTEDGREDAHRTVGNACDEYIAELNKKLLSHKEKVEKFGKLSPDETDYSDLFWYDVESTIGRDGICEIISKSLKDDMKTGEAMVLPYFNILRRIQNLRYGCTLLRKRFVPNLHVGKQWGGHRAVNVMNKVIEKISADMIKEYDDLLYDDPL